MLLFLWFGSALPDLFSINQSFLILFMVIIGGLGSLLGSFLGAGLIYLLPIGLRTVLPAVGISIAPSSVEHLTFMIVGALIIVFLILEPHGLARLWQTAKQKLLVWPFPY
jgi:branched-chain amino acid transport system permease protein